MPQKHSRCVWRELGGTGKSPGSSRLHLQQGPFECNDEVAEMGWVELTGFRDASSGDVLTEFVCHDASSDTSLVACTERASRALFAVFYCSGEQGQRGNRTRRMRSAIASQIGRTNDQPNRRYSTMKRILIVGAGF